MSTALLEKEAQQNNTRTKLCDSPSLQNTIYSYTSLLSFNAKRLDQLQSQAASELHELQHQLDMILDELRAWNLSMTLRSRNY